MNKKIRAESGHTLFVEKTDFDNLPENVKRFEHIGGCKTVYVIKNWDKNGVVFMYVAKKNNQYLVWYRGGSFWSSYGKTIEGAINGAQKDGWMHT